MSQIFFTSDLHFSHKNIAKFCPQFRPNTSSIVELDEFMINVWNRTVRPEDTVYNLGDVSFAGDIKQMENVLRRLNGKHHLIYGNHDGQIAQHQQRFLSSIKHDGNPLLSSAQHYLTLRLPNLSQPVVLFHYPIQEWDGCHKGWYHVYGHLHDRMAAMRGRALNVGYDLHGRFLTAQDIEDYLQPLPKIIRFGQHTIAEATPEQAHKRITAYLTQLNQD